MKKNITYFFNNKRLGIERRQILYSCCIPERRSIKKRRCDDQSKIIENPKAAFAAAFI